jgi:hypothetical protein
VELVVESAAAEASDETATVDVGASSVGTDVVTPTPSGFVGATGDANPPSAESGKTLTLCPCVAAANADSAPASSRDRAITLTPWASSAA